VPTTFPRNANPHGQPLSCCSVWIKIVDGPERNLGHENVPRPRSPVRASLVGVGVLVASAQLNQAPKGKDDHAAQVVRRLNAEEVEAFVHNDPKAMVRLWSDDFVVTNPLNKFIDKQQVLGMVASVLLGDPFLRPADRVYPGLWRYRDHGGQRDGAVGREDAERGKN